MMAKLTEAQETAVAGNAFVPKIPHRLLSKKMAARTPAQSPKPGRPDVAPWGEVMACSLSIGGAPTTKSSALSRCDQKELCKSPESPNRHDGGSKIPGREKQGWLYRKAGPNALGGKEEWAHKRSGREETGRWL